MTVWTIRIHHCPCTKFNRTPSIVLINEAVASALDWLAGQTIQEWVLNKATVKRELLDTVEGPKLEQTCFFPSQRQKLANAARLQLHIVAILYL